MYKRKVHFFSWNRSDAYITWSPEDHNRETGSCVFICASYIFLQLKYVEILLCNLYIYISDDCWVHETQGHRQYYVICIYIYIYIHFSFILVEKQHSNTRTSKLDEQDMQDTSREIRASLSDVPLWTPSHGRARVWWPSRTYLPHLTTDTRCSMKDPLEAIDVENEWRERVREIRISGTPWWWW